MWKLNVERLRAAYAIIEAIPDDKLNLDSVFSQEPLWVINRPDKCSTIACAAGWLSLYPDFKEDLKRATTRLWSDWIKPLQKTFGLTQYGVQDLFGARGDSMYDPEYGDFIAHFTDRQLWLSRVRIFLEDCGFPFNSSEGEST
jgi:hypothetical protein